MMPTDEEVEVAAAAAAEKSNGGKFNDPKFYAPEHKEHWRRIARAQLAAAKAGTTANKVGEAQKMEKSLAKVPDKVSDKEIEEFSSHCVHIRSVYLLGMRIWRDSDATERKTMEELAPSFFENFNLVLGEFLVMAASRITDPAVDKQGNENFTVELFVKSFPAESTDYKDLDALRKRMDNLRGKILPARHKLGAHADREVVRKGEPLGAASWKEWDEFWSVLADFVRALNEKRLGKPYEIDAGGVLGDAEMLLRALRQSQHFETLLNSADPALKQASLSLALQKN